jgi:hypothetical protein
MRVVYAPFPDREVRLFAALHVPTLTFVNLYDRMSLDGTLSRALSFSEVSTPFRGAPAGFHLLLLPGCWCLRLLVEEATSPKKNLSLAGNHSFPILFTTT